MANSDKRITVKPRTGNSTLNPVLEFVGADGSTAGQVITFEVTPANQGTLIIKGASGNIMTISDGAANKVTINAPISFTGDSEVSGNLVFKGTSFSTTLDPTDPTSNRTIAVPDAGGTLAVSVSDTTTTTQGALNLDFTLSSAGNISATGDAHGLSTTSSPTFAGLNIGSDSLSEYIADTVGAMVSSNTETGITVTYQDSDNTLDFVVADFSITLTGDVTGSGTVTGLGNVSFATTIAADSVALGTDTTGNYVASITNGSYITGGNGGTEGAALTLAVDADSANTASKVVARDSSGNFSAGVITATRFTSTQTTGTAPFTVSSTTAVTNLNADLLDGQEGSYYLDWTNTTNKPDPQVTVTLTGDVTGTANTTLTDLGNGTITVSTTIAADSVALGADTTGNYIATITGTTNQVSVSGSGSESAAVTLSLPQNIDTGASPTFAGATLDNIRVGVTGANEIDTSSGNLTLDSTGGTVSVDDNLSVVGDVEVQGGDITTNQTTFNLLNATATTVNAFGAATTISLGASTGTTTVNNSLTVSGDLTINGTTTTINATTITVDDKNIELGSVASPTDITADGGGITLLGTTNKTILWVDATDRWTSNQNFEAPVFVSNISTGTSPFTVSSTTAVTNLNADLLDGQEGSYYLDWTNTTNKPDPQVTVTLTGDVTGTANTTLTDLGNGTITVSTTIAADSVALGTDTTGNYVASITNGSYITGGNGGTEGAALTLAVDADSANTASKVVARDASGNFSAGVITATRFTSTQTTGTAPFTVSSTTAVTNLNADLLDGQEGSYYLDWTNTTNKPDPQVTVTLTGDVTGTANTTLTDLGNGTITVSTTIAADSVALGTDTTGNYVASITNGSYITGGNGGTEGAALTLAVDADSANTASKVVARDASGNFSAGTVTASLSGNASTATALATARTINGVSFDGSANITVTANTTNSHIIKFDTGTTEGTDLYTFDGSAAKTIDIKAGTNVTLTKAAGTITISANDTSVDWSEIQNKPDPQVTVTLTGDVTGTANTTLTDLGNGTITVSTTIAADSVALGTDTTGNYLLDLTAGTGISISGTPGEGWTATITNSQPNVTTDISITHNSDNVVVNSSDGTDGTINAATTSLAGVMTANDKTKLDSIPNQSAVVANTSNNYTIDIANGYIQILTLTDNCTFTFPAAAAAKNFILLLKQDGIGSRTVTWPASVQWPSATNPTITATVNKLDKFSFISDGTNWYGAIEGQNYST
jgi:hypothetical protein